MKKDGDDKILDEIIASLKNHNEGYIDGSWEKFQKKRAKKKKKTVFAIFSGGIAAMFLLCIIVYTADNIKQKQQTEWQTENKNTIQTAPFNKQIVLKTDSVSSKKRKHVKLKEISSLDAQFSVKKQNTILAACIQPAPEERSSESQVQETSQSGSNAVFSNPEGNAAINKYRKMLVYNPPKNKTKKFSWGVLVRNSMGSSARMSLAFGVINEMKFNDKFSCNTGVILDRYKQDPKQPDGMLFDPEEEQEPENVELMFLDIPLNLKMKIAEMKQGNVFVSGGISSLIFINEKYKDGDRRGSKNTSVRFQNINFAGQVNISGGYQYRISTKTNLSVEAYLKVPLYKLAEEKLHFYQSGISMKISR